MESKLCFEIDVDLIFKRLKIPVSFNLAFEWTRYPVKPLKSTQHNKLEL